MPSTQVLSSLFPLLFGGAPGVLGLTLVSEFTRFRGGDGDVEGSVAAERPSLISDEVWGVFMLAALSWRLVDIIEGAG